MMLFRALRLRPFRLLWLGQTLSRVGDFMYSTALAWWVLEETGDAALMGAVLIFAITPSLLFYLIGGVAVDRFSRVGIMLASDVARGAVVLLVSVLALTDRLDIGLIFAATLFFGIVDAFFQPAFTALVPQIVPEAELPSANSLSSMSFSMGRVLGPVAGAGVVALTGIGPAFAINGISFLISALFLLPLWRLETPPVAPEPGASVVRELRAGIAFVRGTPWLWVSILAFALTNISLAGPYAVSMPFLVSDNLGGDVELLGVLYAIFPLGYILGGIVLGQRERIRRRGPLMYGTGIVAALGLGVFGLLPPFWVLVVAALINGAMLEMGHLVWVNTLQEMVPNHMLGRVASLDNIGSFALLPFGYAAAGWATEMYGAPTVFLLCGTFAALVSTVGLLLPAVRRLD